MKKILKTPFILFLLCLCVCFYTHCNPKKDKKITQNIQTVENKQLAIKKAKLDLIFQELVKEKNFNGVVFWRENDKIILQQSYGFLKKKIPLNLIHAYFLGNITETMTALGIFYLEQKKLLNRQDSVGKYITQFPYPDLKIYHLLQHTSGLPDFKQAFSQENNALFTYATNRNVLDWIVVQKPHLTHISGEKILHSPTNYVILARIIELVSQQNYANFLQKTFFNPLDMTQASVLTYNKPKNEHLLRGQDLKLNKFLDDSPFMFIQGSEGVCASILDLEKWDNALHYPKGKFYTLAKNLQQFPPIENPSQASGWAMNGQFFFKQGNGLGFKSAFYYFPTQNRTFILLCNDNTNKFAEILKVLYEVINE